MADTVTKFADLELYADQVSAVAALRLVGDPLLPTPVTRTEVTIIGGVTLIQPDNAAIRDENPLTRPGLRYRDLVRHHGHRRLVIDFAGLQPFGHPFHDDIFAILRELGAFNGRLAVCGAEPWYTTRFSFNHRHLRVIIATS